MAGKKPGIVRRRKNIMDRRLSNIDFGAARGKPKKKKAAKKKRY